MDRLTAADAWYLYLEGPTAPLHVTGLLILDPSTAPRGFSVEQVRDYIESRLDAMPTLRRRLVEVPLAIDHPCWADDPDFDIDNHVHRQVLEDGSPDELARAAGAFATEPLDRSRPLWDLLLIDGLADGTVALAMKLHHCVVDGVSGMDVVAHLLDLAPESPRPRPAGSWQPDRLPDAAHVVASAAWSRLASPLRPARAALGVASSLVRMMGTAIRRLLDGADSVAHPVNAPRTPFNASITPARAIAFGRVPLEDLTTIKRAFGSTVNDVVLALCTHGLRAHLATQHALPDRSLVCSVPVSTHGHDVRDRSINQVSSMFVHLPVHLADPVARLQVICAGSRGAKDIQSSVGAEMIGNVIEVLPTPLFRLVTRLYSQARLADRLAPVHNLIVSNVVGSPVPLYLAGAEVVAMFPFGPLLEGTGLNITVISHNGAMNIGLIACPALVPDVAGLLDAILDGVPALLDAAATAA